MIDKVSLFEDLKSRLLAIDPVFFAEKYLILDGKPFRINGNGYKPFSEIYRYIGIKSLEQDSKPIVLKKARQCGGTVMAAALEMYFVGCNLFGTNGKPPVRIIHAFPQHDQAEQYTKEKLNPMIASSTIVGVDNKGQTRSYMQNLLDQSNNTNDSLKFKAFKNGNFIRIDSTGLDGGRLRGGTADIMFYDEVQDIPAEAIGNTVEMLSQAKYGKSPGGVQVYFGTPKRKGSDFYKMWNVSSQQYYHLGCLNCKEYFPLYTPESDEWEKIWIHGFIVKCPHCKFEQDKRQSAERGKWVGTKDINDPSVRYIGFHINQMYMPNIRREDIDAAKPGIHPTNTQRKFQNEVLGEFFQGDSSPITSEEIIEKCGERDRGMRARIKPGEEQLVVLGIDYGQRSDIEQLADPNRNKAGQSYTTAVVLSIKGSSLFQIDLALKFGKNTPEAKKGLIDTIMRQYSVDIAVGDIGYSNDLSHTLHTIYGNKYLASRAANKINDKIKFNRDTFPPEIIFERDHYIGEMFELLKKGHFKFPLKDYDKIAWLIEHCSGMELKPSLSRFGGDPEIHYVKGGQPNDGFMSLINAYLAYKFFISNGFSIKNPGLMNQVNTPKKVLAVTGFIQRRF